MTYKRSVFPESIDTLTEITDLPPSQKANALRFQELKLKSSLTAEEQIELNSLTTLLQNYLITPETFNKFADICIGLEVFFTSEVQNYVVTKQGEMQDYVVSKQGEMDDYVDGAESDLTDYIDTKTALFDAKLNRFTFLDEYNSITQYRVWNTLSYQGESYLCILDSLGNLPTNTTYFKKIAQKGAQGEDGQQGLSGVGLVFRNSYSATETYNTDECVEYNGSLYACKQDGVSGFLPTNTTYWSLAIAKGASILVTTLRNTVTVSTNVSNVQFLSGGITAFNKNIDSLFVYVNSTYLELNQDYTINANGISIDKVSDSWDGTENSITFNFVVIKNIVESITFNDGALIDEGSILKSALVQSVQDSIDSIGDVDDLETTDKTNLVNAVNETSNKINVSLADYAKHYFVDGEASDAYTITPDPVISDYVVGQTFNFKANTANTGACTLNVNAKGAITIKKNVTQDLETGDILANQIVTVIYDGTNFQYIPVNVNTSLSSHQAEEVQQLFLNVRGCRYNG